MLDCFNTNHNLMDAMNIYLEIGWILRSWNHYVSNTTTNNCFRKSTLLTTPISLSTVVTPPDLLQLYEQAVKAKNIQDFMAISKFLHPNGESLDIEDCGQKMGQEDVSNEVLDKHVGIQLNQDDDEEDE